MSEIARNHLSNKNNSIVRNVLEGMMSKISFQNELNTNQ